MVRPIIFQDFFFLRGLLPVPYFHLLLCRWTCITNQNGFGKHSSWCVRLRKSRSFILLDISGTPYRICRVEEETVYFEMSHCMSILRFFQFHVHVYIYFSPHASDVMCVDVRTPGVGGWRGGVSDIRYTLVERAVISITAQLLKLGLAEEETGSSKRQEEKIKIKPYISTYGWKLSHGRVCMSQIKYHHHRCCHQTVPTEVKCSSYRNESNSQTHSCGNRGFSERVFF